MLFQLIFTGFQENLSQKHLFTARVRLHVHPYMQDLGIHHSDESHKLLDEEPV